MEIIKYKRDDDEGAIIVNGQDHFIAVTDAFSKRFKSMKGAHRFLDSYGYRRVNEKGEEIAGIEEDFPAEMLISAIGSQASRKKFINQALSALTGEPIVTQFMGNNRFLFQFSGKNPEAIRKIKGLFEKQYESFYDEYDSDTNTTAIYMKI